MSLGRISIADLYSTTLLTTSSRRHSTCQNAFFGLVAKGYDIPDFSEPKAKRPFEIPREAIDTEPVVALLQADLLEGLGYSGDSDGIFRDHSASLPVGITDGQLKANATEIAHIVTTLARSTAGRVHDIAV